MFTFNDSANGYIVTVSASPFDHRAMVVEWDSEMDDRYGNRIVIRLGGMRSAEGWDGAIMVRATYGQADYVLTMGSALVHLMSAQGNCDHDNCSTDSAGEWICEDCNASLIRNGDAFTIATTDNRYPCDIPSCVKNADTALASDAIGCYGYCADHESLAYDY